MDTPRIATVSDKLFTLAQKQTIHGQPSMFLFLKYPWVTGTVYILGVSMDNQACFYSWSIHGQPGLFLFLKYPWTTGPVSILEVSMGNQAYFYS
jgi:hypothetical protein